MAGQQDVILPEVHLDSPIVKHKLLYLLKLGGFPIGTAFDGDGPHQRIQRWDRIRGEENQLFSRLDLMRQRLERYTSLRTISVVPNHFSILIWPRCIQLCQTVDLRVYMELEREWKHVTTKACELLDKPLVRCLRDISHKLTNRADLFSRARDEAYQGGEQHPTLQSIERTWEHNPWAQATSTWLMIKHRMRQLITQMKSDPTSTYPTVLETRHHLVMISPELVAIVFQAEKVITYFTFEMVLMVSDVFEGRLNVLSLCQVSNYLSPLAPRITKILALVDQLGTILGDGIYDIIASLESFCYAQLQLEDPVIEIAGTFYAFMADEMLTCLLDSNQFSRDEAYVIVEKLTSLYGGLSPDLTAELLCLMRLWGHPSLVAAQAAGKVRESMCAAKVIQLGVTLKTLAFFHTILINGYRRRHNGIWPPVHLPEYAPLALVELCKDNHEITYDFTLRHWKAISAIQFERCFDADPGEDLSIFMKDKAISCPKQDWMSVFRKSLIKDRFTAAKRDLPQPVNRRLLLNFLEDANFDPVEELKYVTTRAYLTDDEFCASYSLKEKEIKTTGRIFAKLTRRMRSCQVIAEAMLANHAGKLMRENGVVMDQLKLTKSLLTMNQIGIVSQKSRKFTSDNQTIFKRPNRSNQGKTANRDTQRDSDEHEIAACFLTTDLKKYCLQWRYQSIGMFARSLNQMYGYDHLFEWIHLRLMRSTLYVGDPFNPPEAGTDFDLDSVNGDIFIVSPRGGIEGLCQKFWTMISISVILLSAAESGHRVMSMVQGDNQVVAVTTRVPRTLSQRDKKEIAHRACLSFFNRLKENNFGLGHHLKAQETIISSDFFVYSKRVFFRGRILNQALKNASKLCLIADVLGDCSQASCSNLATTVMRLAENGVEKDLCYYLNVYLTIRQVTYDIKFPQVQTYSSDIRHFYANHPHLIARLAVLPSQLGGLNYLSCSRLFNRNIGDPAVSALADLKRLIRCGAIEHWVLSNILMRKPGSGNWSTLAADPYALNVDYLNPPTMFLKKHTQQVLMGQSRNPLLSGIFHENARQEENDLAQFLLDREVVMPRVAYVILAQTSCGRRKQIQGFLDSTRTMIRHALQLQPLSFRKLNQVLEYNCLYLAYSLEIIEYPKEVASHLMALTYETCSIDLARTLRKLSWASLLAGRPIEGLETPDPIELLDGALVVGSGTCLQCEQGDTKFSWFYLPDGIQLDRDPMENPPIRVPYIGSKTDERRVASMTYVKGASSALRSALRLAGVYIWAFGEDEVSWVEAHALAQTRVTITMDQLRALTPLPTSANITHRLDDGTTQLKFTPASSYAFSSYVHISNDDQVLELDDKVLDSNLIYQQVMITGLGVIESWNNPPISTNEFEVTLHLHTGSSCCIRPIEQCVQNPALLALPDISTPYHNKFVFDQDPLTDTVQERIDTTIYANKINSIDFVPLVDRIPLLSQLVGRSTVNSIIGLDESTSIMNDAVVESDYANNWISECLYSYIDQVILSAAWNLLLELAYQMYYLRVRGRDAILEYMHSVLRRIPGLVFGGMSATISHPKILRRLINLGIIRPTNSPYFATLDYVRLCVDALMWGSRRVLTDLASGYSLPILITSELSFILNDRMMNLVSRSLSLISCLLSSGHEQPKVKGCDPTEKCAMLTYFLMQGPVMAVEEYEQRERLKKLIQEPKIDTYPNNIYYLTRKLLNEIRGSEESRFMLTLYYESMTIDGNPLEEAVQWPVKTQESLTLTLTDFHVPIINPTTRLEKYQYPDWAIQTEEGQFHAANPPTHHVLRPLGLSSTSWYKSLSVVEFLSRRRLVTGNHLYLAEGSGASMSLIESYIPGPIIYYNSLFHSGENPPQRNFAPQPTQFMESIPYKQILADIQTPAGFVQQFVPLWTGQSVQTDLNRKECTEYIINKVGVETCGLVHVDLEDFAIGPSAELTAGTIHSIIIATTVLKPGGALVFKTYWTPFSRFSRLISVLWMFFEEVTAIRSSYSDPHKTEVYLCALFAGSSARGSISQAIHGATLLHTEGFTMVAPAVVETFLVAHKNQSNVVCQEIDRIVLTGDNSMQDQDNQLIIAAGGALAAQLWHDNPVFQDWPALVKYLVTVITTHLKEIIETSKVDTLEYESLLMTAYNTGSFGRINTITNGLVETVLISVARNWLTLTEQYRLRLKHDLELGVFRVRSLLNAEQFLGLTENPKYLLSALGKRKISEFFDERAVAFLSRPMQKRVWKTIGCALMEGDPVAPLSSHYLQEEDVERDIAGDIL
ncbi:TPA_inf: RNA polymerase [La Piedad Michoacan Mexico virus]|uniref:RNA-directed RNA polymerase L n=1 Tax=La Piedad Michoacan Mexico virus TaxID=2898537 RepID=A7E3F3_LPMV|nr:RNA polymerase [Orthorubulavirus suis]DAA06049.1 TPA_inf: RNA polymerase [La Piedad Michoacan Mexico virus]